VTGAKRAPSTSIATSSRSTCGAWAVHHLVHGKRRRSFTKKARQLLECGQRARFRRWTGCNAAGGKSARVLTRCDLRSCVFCARRRADDFRCKLTDLRDRGDKPRKMALYLITFTLRYDPTSPDDLFDRRPSAPKGQAPRRRPLRLAPLPQAARARDGVCCRGLARTACTRSPCKPPTWARLP
jgi:hypothetical protein